MDITQTLNKLITKQDLTTHELRQFLEEVMNGTVTPSQTAAALVALRMKGESIEEIIGCIQAMRENMLKIQGDHAIDVCGTGGDASGTFNISTTAAFVIAGAGIPVAKHGNRAASSRCGSADVLEHLGVKIELSSKHAEKVLKKVGMVFLFAPLYHPATKNVVLVRRELKIRTIFNFLGPFANPASVTRQIIGVPNTEIAEKLAEVGKELGYQHLFIVSSSDGLDEISTAEKTTVFEIKNKRIKRFILDPREFGFKGDKTRDLLGGTVEENADIIQNILSGEKGAKRDIVVFNSAAGLYISGKVKTIQDGIRLSENSIDSGNAKSVLQNLISETQKYA